MFGLLAFCLLSTLPSEPAIALTAKIDAIVADTLQDEPSVGLSIAVHRNGAAIFVKAYGNADLKSARPLAARSIYRIGSLTKQFTAAAIVQLIEHGKLSPDDDI